MSGVDEDQTARRTMRWMSTSEAAEMLGISLRTVYRIINDGQLVAYRLGRNMRVIEADVYRFLDQNRVEPGSIAHLCNPYEGRDGVDDELDGEPTDIKA